MKRKCNGMTIVEVLVSILIIAIVVVLLFNMLIQIKNEDNNNNIQSNFLLNQATFIKAIEEDAVNYGVDKISPCSLTEAKISSELLNRGYESNFKCIKIKYSAKYTEDNIGFIMLYNTFEKYDMVNGKYQGIQETSSWMIQYVRGHYKFDNTGYEIGNPNYKIDNPNISSWEPLMQTMRSLPTDVDMSLTPYLIYTAAESSHIGGVFNTYNAGNLIIPIVNPEGEHYDINVAFIFNGIDTFRCRKSNPRALECKCTGDPNLCNRTYEY